MEARLQADKGPWALWHGHSPILLCASQNVRSGMSEELEQRGKKRSEEITTGEQRGGVSGLEWGGGSGWWKVG